MSIKKLFGDTVGDLRSADYKNQKETFQSVESERNAVAIQAKENTFVPQVDFSEPENFAKYGSAYLYYSGALNRILDFYPYDGSKAEKNEFYNGLMGVEKYVFDNLYPKSTGYINMSADGWGTRSGDLTADGYGTPSTYEYITFKGGPGTGSAGTSLVSKSPNSYSSKFTYSNIYDTSIYTTANLPTDYGKGTRESNLKANFDTGITVEFWLKKDSFDVTKTQREVVFDLWNSSSIGNTDYGRLTIAIQGSSGSQSPFLLTAQSGTVSASFVTQSIGNNLTPSSLAAWQHYAFVFQNSGSMLRTQLYVNGYLNDTTSSFSSVRGTSGSLGEITGSLIGRIGGFITNPTNTTWQWQAPSASSARNGDGKLSASIDEFRYWKVARNAQQIGENFFVGVGGGTNSDISNTTLGVYYKFNEGITTVAATDSIVLDYAGRVTNGAWTGYTSNSRNSGSAIVSASAAPYETGDPIMRSQHTDVSTLQTNLLESGSFYDSNNNSAFINYAPAWVLEEHENDGNNNLKFISHIMGAYFDKMYLLTKQLPALRQTTYTTASHRPYPFASHLPQSLGLYSPEIFVDSTILEKFESRTEKELFESKLVDAKNLIYLNLYNNLTNIYKAKGTEKAIRNVMRCFNLDDSLLRLNVYNRDHTYELKNNLQQSMFDRTSLDFNQPGNIHAVVYQALTGTSSPVSSGGQTLGYISASRNSTGGYNAEAPYGATLEASLTLPKFFVSQDKFNRSWISSSLFGIYQVTTGSTTNESGSATTLRSADEVNFQVYAVRDAEYSKNVRFLLSSSISPNPVPVLSSSTFLGAYDDSQWNISVRIKPKLDPVAGFVTGANVTSEFGYDVVFRGVNTILGTVRNSFEITGAMGAPTHNPGTYTETKSFLSGTNFLHSAKRVYVGARRTDLTGAVLNPSDVKFHSVRYWTKAIDNLSLDQHVQDIENSGISGSYRELAARDPLNIGRDITNANTLALNWKFDNLSNASTTAGGYFNVTDYSSGSQLIRDNYGWLGKITGYQHGGYGYGFPASSKTMTTTELTNVFKFINPEQAVASDMVQILDKDDEVFGVVETVPNFVYALEKSQQQAISDEMLDFFAGVVDFNDLIGAPINRYRDRYKDLEKLREAFYRRVTKVTDVEKFVGYYKWFDDALTEIVSQLVPASADMQEGVLNTIEPTVLDRPKYETKYPTMEAKQPDPEGVVAGEAEAIWDAALDRTTIPRSPRDTTRHVPFWKTRALRTAPEISTARFGKPTGSATDIGTIMDNQRETFRRVINAAPHMSSSGVNLFDQRTQAVYKGNKFKVNTLAKLFRVRVDKKYDKRGSIKGGVNFDTNKKIHFTYTALHPAGKVDQSGGKFIPQNVLIGFMKDLVALPYDNDPKLPTEKIKRYITVHHGQEKAGGDSERLKSSMVFPFNLIESSVKSGYQKEVYDKLTASFEITNLHHDTYGDDMEKPLQGPFTEYAVGGHQSRHVPINYSSSTRPLDTWKTRPEAWKILLGTCDSTISGAIGMVGADYPWPEWNGYPDVPGNYPPYPMTAAMKAVYYRDEMVKRPVNIRNIHLTFGSTILGNYRHNYDIVNSVGAFNNPRGFIENQPILPDNVFQPHATGATSTNTILDMPRLLRPGTVPTAIEDKHFTFVEDYSTSYLTSAINKSIIVSRFNNNGGAEVQNRGHQDFRSSEYSVYNALNFKNLTVIKPSQGPSGTISETEGIRVYDIHGKDYGLRSQLSRHTARFGRDSLFVTSAAIPYGNASPGGTYNQLPGFHKVHRNNLKRPEETCQEWTPIYSGISLDNNYECGYGASNVNTTLLATGYESVSSTQGAKTEALMQSFAGGDGFSWTGWINFAEWSTNLFEDIINIGLLAGSASRMRITKTSDGSNLFLRLYVAVTDGAPAWNFGYNVWEWKLGTMAPLNWMHLGLTWQDDDGTLSDAAAEGAATLYLNGVSGALETFTQLGVNYRYYRPTAGTLRNTFRGWTMASDGVGQIEGDAMMILGGNVADIHPLSASVDEYTLWSKKLTADNMVTIYNSGKPCDITASGLGAGLYDWIRFEPTQSFVVRADNSIGPNIHAGNTCEGVQGNTWSPMAVKGSPNNMIQKGASLSGCTQAPAGFTETICVTKDNVYDNFFVQHQIPRASTQYKWITQSVADTNNVVGFTPPMFKIDAPGTVKRTRNAYDFVSCSDFGAYKTTMTGRITWGKSKTTSWGATTSPRIFQPSEMNFVVREPANQDTYTIGYPATYISKSFPLVNVSDTTPESQYRNTTMVDNVGGEASTPPFNYAEPQMFNSLMIKRNGFYGYPTWKQVRNADNPIARWERKNNMVSMMSVTGARGEQARYHVPPVSMESRPQTVNMNIEGINFAVDVTHNLEEVYYPSVKMENQLNIEYDRFDTPFEQLIRTTQQPANGVNLNWVLNVQKLFPSNRNEFCSGAIKRLNYNNMFWANNRLERNIKASLTANEYNSNLEAISKSFGRGDYKFSLNSQRQAVMQSCWPLDAPVDFMTRTRPDIYSWRDVSGAANLPFSGYGYYGYRGQHGVAGELQNSYTNYFTSSISGSAAAGYAMTPWRRLGYVSASLNSTQVTNFSTLGALYSRKHLLGIRSSVVSPSGMKINQTGSREWSRASSYQIDGWERRQLWEDATQILPIGGGEALWEAGAQAGIISTQESSSPNGKPRYAFEFTASAPWKFNSYEEFRHDLKLMAKDYSIVPEYRISEHVEEYLDTDPLNRPPPGGVIDNADNSSPGKGTFEIPGSGYLHEEPSVGAADQIDADWTGSIDSRNTQTFFLDYSNTEFLKDFLKIKRETILGATQIKLVCSAAIRFHPYKGFYPAQRTIDLASQFKKSYQKSLYASTVRPASLEASDIYQGGNLFNQLGWPYPTNPAPQSPGWVATRPIMSALFSPGILFNSIKSGIAVDYPLVVNGTKMTPSYYGASGSSTGGGATLVPEFGHQDNYALTYNKDWLGRGAIGQGEQGALQDSQKSSRVFFDKRVPFETMVTPAKYLNGISVPDQEAHPSASLRNLTCSFAGDNEDPAYTLMARNFFGETAAFFLKDSDYTSLKSGVLRKNLQFSSGSTYMARIKMNRSMEGQRTYLAEAGGVFVTNSAGAATTYASPYGTWGARAFNHFPGSRQYMTGSNEGNSPTYPLPQDPYQTDYRENFTMYSRPTAFGPAIAGRDNWSASSGSVEGKFKNSGSNFYPLDSFNGFNWAYTPPYYDGEAWADLIFRPSHTKSYDIQQIMAETIVQYWRCDAGPPVFLNQLTSSTSARGDVNTLLISGAYTQNNGASSGSSVGVRGTLYPYSGLSINQNAMQLSASLNIFGIEEVPFEEIDEFGNLTTQRNDSVGQRWVIKPKWETPILNFHGTNNTEDLGIHDIGPGGNPGVEAPYRPLFNNGPMVANRGFLTIPTHMSAAVPRGMWHQFGIMDPDPAKGIFLQVGDIPEEWLKYHWTMLNTGSIYNNYSATLSDSGISDEYSKIKSLSKLVGFDRGGTGSRVRMGEIANRKTVREAIVALPYIIETVTDQVIGQATQSTSQRKKFVEISPERLRASSDNRIGSAEGDSLIAAGESIRKQIQKMKKYVMPPQFDFLNNDNLPAIAMYIFEFEHTFDRDDLSYMWQNLAPRASEKIHFKTQSIAHELINSELLSEEILEENQNLRWMVFKVKQRAQTDYYELTLPQVGEAQTLGLAGSVTATGNKGSHFTPGGTAIHYNWPYDYLSLVEMIKIDAQVLFSAPIAPDGTQIAPTQGNTIAGTPTAAVQTMQQSTVQIPSSQAQLVGSNNIVASVGMGDGFLAQGGTNVSVVSQLQPAAPSPINQSFAPTMGAFNIGGGGNNY